MTTVEQQITISLAELGRQLAEMAQTATDMRTAELAHQLNTYINIATSEQVHPAFLDGLRAAAAIIAGSGQIVDAELRDAE